MTTTAGTVVLVEGVSDAAALLAAARLRGRDLAAENVEVRAMGGATNVGRALTEVPAEVRVAGLYDAPEERFFRRGLVRTHRVHDPGADLEGFGFFECVRDLEDELIRALGTDTVLRVVESQGELGLFGTLQKQPAQRDRSLTDQLHRFMGTRSGRKERYASALGAVLDPERLPRPLDRLLRHL